MLDATLVAGKFEKALAYDKYVATGTEEQRRRWGQVHEVAKLTAGQRELVGLFTREMNVLVISGIWCGDCVQQCPLMERIAAANPKIHLRFVDRDEQKDLSARVTINGGDRVPVAIFMAEDFQVCAVAGDRTLSRYRALARKQLGAACEIAVGRPDEDEIGATLADWVGEFERVQLMLRLSTRLRQKHGD